MELDLTRLIQFTNDVVSMLNMKRLRLLHRGEDIVGRLRVVTIAMKLSDQLFLPCKVPLAFCHVAFRFV